MSERLSFPGHGKKPEFDVKVLEISDLPKGPENLLFGLTRITNLKVGSMDLPQVSLQGFNDQLQAISTSLGRKPHALVLCNAGILRSKILAEYLFREQTVELESPNMNKRKNRARGLGVNSGLRDFVFDFSPEGLAIVEEGKEERIDLLILALAGSDKDPLDAQALGRMAAFLDEGLRSINSLNHLLNILWLNGIESEFTSWIPQSVKK